MKELKLTLVTAYTINSADSDKTSSNKGLYKNYEKALAKSIKAGYYGSDGRVIEYDDVYEDPSGELFEVRHLGKFNDIEEEAKEQLLQSIKSKLSEEELTLLGIL